MIPLYVTEMRGKGRAVNPTEYYFSTKKIRCQSSKINESEGQRTPLFDVFFALVNGAVQRSDLVLLPYPSSPRI